MTIANICTVARDVFATRDAAVELDYALQDSRPPDGWFGMTATVARAEQSRLAEKLRRLVAGVSAVRPGVAGAADAVAGLHRGIADAEGLARAHGFAVAPDGTVTDVAAPVVPADQVEAVRRERTVVQAEIVDRIEQVLRRADADQIDDGTGDSLAGAATIGQHAGGLPLTGPPPGGTIGDNAGWWSSLSAAEQAQVIAEHPDWIGNLDGIPAAARDDANRARLDSEITRIDAEIRTAQSEWERLSAEPLPPGMEGQGETRDQIELREHLTGLREQRSALGAVQDTIAVAPDDRQLLLLDLAHDRPRAAVAVGDVDTADHVAVFTPGMESDVAGDLGRYTDDMGDMRQTAVRELIRHDRPDETVAAVAWIGYEPPRATLNDLLDPDHTFATDGAAERGGADLSRFLDGINASRPDDPHLTALGHSYGSTTTGHALQQASGVDDAVLFGSPGASTDDVTDLNVPAGHVAVIEARGDAVADLGTFGGDANQLDGVVGLSAHEEHLPGRVDPLRESTGHSAYLTPGTTSQYNIASTVAGLHDQRVQGGSTGAGDWIRAAWDAF